MEITTARYINVNGSLLDLSQPRVMGILTVTPALLPIPFMPVAVHRQRWK